MTHIRRWGPLVIACVALCGADAHGQVRRPTSEPKRTAPSPAGATPVSTQEQALDVGSVADGALAPGDAVWPERRFVDSWVLRGRAGSTVVVDLLSDEFDAVLYLVGGFRLDWNDDGGGGCDARIEVTFPTTGLYALLVSTYGAEAGGRYSLRVSDRPGQPLAGTCGSSTRSAVAAQLPPPNETCLATRRMAWLSIAAQVGGGRDLPMILARERTACELGVEVQSGEDWPNGSPARLGNRWDYPNGITAVLGARWDYPNGNTAYLGGHWSYPDGSMAYLGGRWFLPNGTPTTAAGIIEYALPRLAPGRGEELMSYYRESTGDWQSIMLIVMASEASR